MGNGRLFALGIISIESDTARWTLKYFLISLLRGKVVKEMHFTTSITYSLHTVRVAYCDCSWLNQIITRFIIA